MEIKKKIRNQNVLFALKYQRKMHNFPNVQSTISLGIGKQ
jgi:hypothetical protein